MIVDNRGLLGNMKEDSRSILREDLEGRTGRISYGESILSARHFISERIGALSSRADIERDRKRQKEKEKIEGV